MVIREDERRLADAEMHLEMWKCMSIRLTTNTRIYVPFPTMALSTVTWKFRPNLIQIPASPVPPSSQTSDVRKSGDRRPSPSHEVIAIARVLAQQILEERWDVYQPISKVEENLRRSEGPCAEMGRWGDGEMGRWGWVEPLVKIGKSLVNGWSSPNKLYL